jgi:hypothetical protein
MSFARVVRNLNVATHILAKSCNSCPSSQVSTLFRIIFGELCVLM